MAACRRDSNSADGGQTRARITPRSAAASNRLGYQRSHSGRIASTVSRRLIERRVHGGGRGRRRIGAPHVAVDQPLAVDLLPELDELAGLQRLAIWALDLEAALAVGVIAEDQCLDGCNLEGLAT